MLTMLEFMFNFEFYCVFILIIYTVYVFFFFFFQLCGGTTARQAAAFSFGTAYQQSVRVSSLVSHRDGND